MIFLISFSPLLFHQPPRLKQNGSRYKILSHLLYLVRLRDNWLNPPGCGEAELKKRTLTNLYNQRPTWLANAHARLDRAVFAAYGWEDTLNDEQILERLLALNLERAASQGNTGKPESPGHVEGEES